MRLPESPVVDGEGEPEQGRGLVTLPVIAASGTRLMASSAEIRAGRSV